MKEKTKEILLRMEKEYGRDLTCYLNHDDGWQLLIATIMSAQCTDARVNEVTKVLFKKYPSIEFLFRIWDNNYLLHLNYNLE